MGAAAEANPQGLTPGRLLDHLAATGSFRYAPSPVAAAELQAALARARRRAKPAKLLEGSAWRRCMGDAHMQAVDADIELARAYRAVCRTPQEEAARARKVAELRNRAFDAQIRVIRENRARGQADEPAPRVATPRCQGRAPRVATNTRTRGSRRSTSTSTSRGDPDEPPPALAGPSPDVLKRAVL